MLDTIGECKVGAKADDLGNDEFAWVDEAGEVHRIRIIGHRVLVRRLRPPETYWLVGDVLHAKSDPVFGKMAAPALRTWQQRAWVYLSEVLAVSKQLDQPRTWRTMKRFRIPVGRRTRQWKGRRYYIDTQIACPIVPGDRIILPEISGNRTMWRGITGSSDDCLVDVSEIIAYIPWETLPE